MLTFASPTRIFLAVVPVDLRGSFNRLSSLVEKVLAQIIEHEENARTTLLEKKPKQAVRLRLVVARLGRHGPVGLV